YEPPQGEIETQLAAIWAEVLKLDRVGRHDHFFDLGGHSLRAIQLMIRIREASQIGLRLATVFEFPVLQRLAEHLETVLWVAKGQEPRASEGSLREETEL